MTWIRRWLRRDRRTGDGALPRDEGIDDIRAAIDAGNETLASLREQLERRTGALEALVREVPAATRRLARLEEQVGAIRTLLRPDRGTASGPVNNGSTHGAVANGDRAPVAIESAVGPAPEVVVAPSAASIAPGDGRWLLPMRPDGGGGPPDLADGTAAIAQLEVLRAKGAGRLVVPPSALEWFAAHPRLAGFVETRYGRLGQEAADGISFSLAEPPADDLEGRGEVDALVVRLRDRLGRDPAILNWGSGDRLVRGLAGATVFEPPVGGPTLPYLDGSWEVVAIPGARTERLTEARRVASEAVAVLSEGTETIEWVGREGPRRTVSVVVPVHNAVEYTRWCLSALAGSWPASYEVEVIVVDDASSDETPDLLSRAGRSHGWLRSVRNDANLGFIGSCNRAAAEAGGEILVLLNNDTVPLPGWLEALCRVLADRPDAGAVGGKLLFPDGRLQEAGGVIFSDASGANFGRGDREVDYPLYDYVRPVDYCSGALLATRRELFVGMGGFDVRYAPAYYEDTDYCFSLRERGYAVYYQPRSAVVHFEGGTSGTDISKGTKRFQQVNREKFRDKWASALESQPPPVTNGFQRSTWHRLAVRGAA